MSTKKEFEFDEIVEIVKTLTSKTEFHKKYGKLYNYCKKKGWLEEINKFIPRKRKWDLPSLKIEAKKYKTRSEFMKSNISAYNTALKSEYYDEIVQHMGEPNKFEPKVKWTKDIVYDLYQSCKSLKELRNNHGQKIITIAKNKGWHNEFSKHFTKESHPNLIWTFDKVKNEALKYKTRKEFGQNSPSAYQRAITMEWIDQITTHMEKGYTKWTKEKMMEIISECKTIKDVKQKSPSLYVYIKRKKIGHTLFTENHQ